MKQKQILVQQEHITPSYLRRLNLKERDDLGGFGVKKYGKTCSTETEGENVKGFERHLK